MYMLRYKFREAVDLQGGATDLQGGGGGGANLNFVFLDKFTLDI